MDNRYAVLFGLSCALLAGLPGCGKDSTSAAGNDVRQTRFPGAVTAGGGTSGEVMARAGGATNAKNSGGTPGIPAGKGGTTSGAGSVKGSGEEAVRGQAATPGGSVSGTPGIPEGAGGTPSGAEMGGTTHGAAGSKAVPEPKQEPQQERAAPAQKQQ